jgi:hypothetical protein
MLTRSTALLLAAIEYEYYGVYTTSAQRSEIQGPMPVSLPSSGPGPEGGDDDGGGSDDDDNNNGNATRPTINVTAINNTATLALDDLEELLTSLESDANIKAMLTLLGEALLQTWRQFSLLPKHTRQLKWNNTSCSRRGRHKMMTPP